MAEPFTLEPLIKLAQHRNDAAKRKLGQLNRQQESAEEKLETLRQFRKDYQARLQEAAQQGMSQSDLRNFHQFIGKIDEAIIQQLKQVEQSMTSTQVGRDEFDMTQRKLKSFDMLQQRHIEAQKKAAQKAEQKEQDEHTGRMAAYKMNAMDDH